MAQIMEAKVCDLSAFLNTADTIHAIASAPPKRG
jgi:hypothetical protein